MSALSTAALRTQTAGAVLVVDDSRLVRFMVSRHLAGAGYVVAEADNGAAALKMLAQGNFDVVITDLRMPELDGFGVLAAVKSSSPDTEVIILTGTSASDVSCAVRALRLGAHDYLRKPPQSADEVVLTVERAVEKKRLKEANRRLLRELEAESRTDSLRGLANRRAFDEAAAREMAGARRHGYALGVMILDIDHFKAVNDTHGHAAGDRVLAGMAGVAARSLREGDLLFRLGGEEFVALLPHADARAAANVAERVRLAVEAASIHSGSEDIKVTISAGVTCLAGEDADCTSLLDRADKALYAAKRAGRNRVQASGPGTHLNLVAGGKR
jgi:two-component system, cell cycle response regulator